jgi:uncharacterized membrane protein YcaP (DUF421 family)
MLYHDVPFGHAVLILVGVSLVAIGVEYATTKWHAVRAAVDAHPVVLVVDGTVLRAPLHHERITERELYAVLRENGARSVAQVQLAVLEVTGRISVFLDESERPGDEDLLDYLRERARDDAGHRRDPALAPAAS